MLRGVFGRFFKLLVLTSMTLTVSLVAKEYKLTSFYAAYDPQDNRQYVLVMPMVEKVYTHEAGKIRPEDLTRIDSQFVSFPEYNDGELCFSKLKEGASGENGASTMAGKCYTINFFYTQKEYVDEGMAFILTYTRGSGGDKVYEGLAGKSTSFKVVRDGDTVYNENSITHDDYTQFWFDRKSAVVVLGEKKPEYADASIQGRVGNVVNPITGMVEIDMDGDGRYDGVADSRYRVSSTEEAVTLSRIPLPKGKEYSARFTVAMDGYVPFRRLLKIEAGESYGLDASNAKKKPLLKSVVAMETSAQTAASDAFLRFGVLENGRSGEGMGALVSRKDLEPQSDIQLGEEARSEFLIPTEAIPRGVETLEATLQTFDATQKEDLSFFPGRFQGIDAKKNTKNLRFALFDLLQLTDQNDRRVEPESMGKRADGTSCTLEWKRYLNEEQVKLLKEWMGTEAGIGVWALEPESDKWISLGTVKVVEGTRPYVDFCFDGKWTGDWIGIATEETDKGTANVCIESTDKDGVPIANLLVTARKESGQYAYAYTDRDGEAVLTLPEGSVEGWKFAYEGALTGWTELPITEAPKADQEEGCDYRLKIENLDNPYTTRVTVHALQASGAIAEAGGRVVLYHDASKEHYYYRDATVDENGTATFSVEPGVEYTVLYGAGRAHVNVDGELQEPEESDDGKAAVVSVRDIDQKPQGTITLSCDVVRKGLADYIGLTLNAYDDNAEPLKLDSLVIVGIGDAVVADRHVEHSDGYYALYGSLDISKLEIGSYTLRAVVSDGETESTLEKSFEIAKDRAPIIAETIEADRLDDNGSVASIDYLGTAGGVVKPGTYRFLPNAYDPDGDDFNLSIRLDDVELNATAVVEAGRHELLVTSTYAGTETASRKFVFDARNLTPEVSGAGLTPNPIDLKRDDAFVLYAYVQDPDGDGVAKVMASDIDTGKSYTLSEEKSGRWSVTIPLKDVDDGRATHRFRVSASDMAESDRFGTAQELTLFIFDGTGRPMDWNAFNKVIFPGHSAGMWANTSSFAAIKLEKGRVVTWGVPSTGGDSSAVADKLENVRRIYSTTQAFAALKEDGTVVTWGDAGSGGDSSGVEANLTKVKEIFSTTQAFAALKEDGTVVTWGAGWAGGDSSSVRQDLVSVKAIFSNGAAFAALKEDGTVTTWGWAASGGDSSSVSDELSRVEWIASTENAFAALRQDGTVVTWGDQWNGGDSSKVTDELKEVLELFATRGAFAALKKDGTVVTWGDANRGGDASSVRDDLKHVVTIRSTDSAFAALKEDGTVVTWGDNAAGGDSGTVQEKLRNVKALYATSRAFAALKNDGKVVTWGDGAAGGDTTEVESSLHDVVRIYATASAFAALEEDGRVVSWGGGLDSYTANRDRLVNVVAVIANSGAFVAIRDDGVVVPWGNVATGGDTVLRSELYDIATVAPVYSNTDGEIYHNDVRLEDRYEAVSTTTYSKGYSLVSTEDNSSVLPPLLSITKGVALEDESNILGGMVAADRSNPNHRGYDALLMKTDPQGAVVWVRNLRFANTSSEDGADWNEAIKAIEKTRNGDYLAFSDVMPGGDTSKQRTMLVSFDGEGNIDWKALYSLESGHGLEIAKAVLVDDGAILVGNGDVSFKDDQDRPFTVRIGVVLRVDTEGEVLWAKAYTNPVFLNNDLGVGSNWRFVDAGSDGDRLYVAGWADVPGGWSALMVQLDTNGTFEWAKEYAHRDVNQSGTVDRVWTGVQGIHVDADAERVALFVDANPSTTYWHDFDMLFTSLSGEILDAKWLGGSTYYTYYTGFVMLPNIVTGEMNYAVGALNVAMIRIDEEGNTESKTSASGGWQDGVFGSQEKGYAVLLTHNGIPSLRADLYKLDSFDNSDLPWGRYGRDGTFHVNDSIGDDFNVSKRYDAARVVDLNVSATFDAIEVEEGPDINVTDL